MSKKRPVAIAFDDDESMLIVVALDMWEDAYRTARLKLQRDNRGHADRQIKRLQNVRARMTRARIRGLVP